MIKCDGTALSDFVLSSMTGLMVENRLDLPGAFAITLTDRSLSLIDRNKGLLREGVGLEISLGYGQKFSRLITGEVSAVSAVMSPQGVSSHIAGFDKLHRLARGTSYRSFGDSADGAQADSLIAQTLIKEVKLDPVVSETHKRNAPRTQDNRSNLDFLVMLAKLNGFYLYADDNSVYFTGDPPERGEIEFEWGNNLISFYPRLSLDGLVETLEARGRDASLGENYEESLNHSRDELLLLSSAGNEMLKCGSGGRSALDLHDALITGSGDAKAFLRRVMREKQAVIVAGGSCTGDPKLLAGASLKITGAGRFDGKYFVTRAIHRFDDNGYITEFEARIIP